MHTCLPRLPRTRNPVNRLVSMVGCAGLVALLSTSVSAHHSAAIFDFGRRIEMSGTVKDIRVINPHMSLLLEVADGKDVRTISFEGHSVNNFYRSGWRPGMVKVGDKIKVSYAPRKDGADGGFVNAFTTEQGVEVAFKPAG